MEERSGFNNKSYSKGKRDDLYHVLHKVPYGDSPYVRAKHAQLVEKDPEAAIVLFWKAINAGDKVDSALKDMAVVMKQLDRSEEAIEAICSFRGLCSKQSQESLDNVLIDLYKKCGKLDEQIELLKRKLKLIYQGETFNGKLTKTARSHGKKFQVSIKQETSRILDVLHENCSGGEPVFYVSLTWKWLFAYSLDGGAPSPPAYGAVPEQRSNKQHDLSRATTISRPTLPPKS